RDDLLVGELSAVDAVPYELSGDIVGRVGTGRAASVGQGPDDGVESLGDLRGARLVAGTSSGLVVHHPPQQVILKGRGPSQPGALSAHCEAGAELDGVDGHENVEL